MIQNEWLADQPVMKQHGHSKLVYCPLKLFTRAEEREGEQVLSTRAQWSRGGPGLPSLTCWWAGPATLLLNSLEDK